VTKKSRDAYCLFNNQKELFNISKITDSLVLNDGNFRNEDSICLDYFNEGRIFDLNSNEFLYFPYRLSYIIRINKNSGDYKVFKTIDTEKFTKLIQIKVTMPQGGYMLSCQPKAGADFIQSSICTNSKNIFIQTNKLLQENHSIYQLIDLYNIHTLEYIKTLRICISKNSNEYLLDIRANDNYIFAISSNGSLYKINL
jgi:hypothetical protein